MARKSKETKKENKKSKKKKGNVISVNFDDVKSYKLPPEGPYTLKVVSAEFGTSKSEKPKVDFEFEVSQGKYAGSKVWLAAPLFKFREFLEAIGHEIEQGDMEIDLDEVLEVEVGATLVHEKYEDTTRAKINDFLATDEVDSEDEEEETDEEDDKPAKTKAKDKPAKTSKKKGPSIDEMDEDELAEYIEEHGLDVDLDDYSTIKKKRAAVAEAAEGDDEEEESDDEEKYTEDQINEMDSEELQKLNDDLDLDCEDVEDMKPKAARKIILKALKKKKLLED